MLDFHTVSTSSLSFWPAYVFLIEVVVCMTLAHSSLGLSVNSDLLPICLQLYIKAKIRIFYDNINTMIFYTNTCISSIILANCDTLYGNHVTLY